VSKVAGLLPVLCLFGAWPRCHHDPAVHTGLDWRNHMVGSPVRTSRVRRLVTLLAMAVIAALSGVAPVAAGGKPMPAGRPPYLADPADPADPAVTTLAVALALP
jgi:hypothetical protein